MTSKSFASTFGVCATLSVFIANPLFANSPPELDPQNKVVGVGQTINFVVAPTDRDGVVPDVYMRNAPESASLNDNGDGTRTFSWQPNEVGDYWFDFIVRDAQDNSLKNFYPTEIRVVEPTEVIVELQGSEDAISSIGQMDAIVGPVEVSAEELKIGAKRIHISDRAGDVKKIISNLAVSSSQTSVQQSPIDTSGEYIYTANIEPGYEGDKRGLSQKTVLRQGKQLADHSWVWNNVTVDDRTMHNKWHTAPSVAVDKTGHIHVAYNMHNFPWQYKRSERQHDIQSLVFNGQNLSDADLKRAVVSNRTNFPTLGTAEIPGNQITYPRFLKDNNRDLYVSYRFAATPNLSFENRTMSTGIAVYNSSTKTWAPIGGDVKHKQYDFKSNVLAPENAVAFAGKQGWTSYHPKTIFDNQNNMLVSLFWRQGGAGEMVKMPCVVRSVNREDVTDIEGKNIATPITPDNCGNIGFSNNDTFYSIGSFALDKQDTPYLLLSPSKGKRIMTHYSATKKRWIREEAPIGATEIFFDKRNNLYAISSGIRIYKRSNNEGQWRSIYNDSGTRNCYPKVIKDEEGINAFIHTQSCDEKTVTIYGLRLP